MSSDDGYACPESSNDPQYAYSQRPRPKEIAPLAIKKIDKIYTLPYTTDMMARTKTMAKTTQFYFRLSPGERRLLDRAAQIDRRSLSDFIRLAAIDKADELIQAEKQRKGVK